MPWKWSQEKFLEADRNDHIYYTGWRKAFFTKSIYEHTGVPLQTLWTDVHNKGWSRNVNYSTQNQKRYWNELLLQVVMNT